MSRRGNSYGRRERWLAVLLSAFVHASIAGFLGWGWWQFRAPHPLPQQLAIEATVVVERTATAAPASASAAPEPAPAAQATPVDERAPIRQEQEERRDAQERAAQQRADDQARREREREQQEAVAAQRRQEEAAAARKAAEAARRAAADNSRREAELRAQLAAEERINAARGSAEEAAWLALIRDRVNGAWFRPPSARPGVNCEVHVTQIPGGVVTGVQIGSCNGDEAVRESIEAAVYRASPLPAPSNPDLFDRNLKFSFHPDE